MACTITYMVCRSQRQSYLMPLRPSQRTPRRKLTPAWCTKPSMPSSTGASGPPLSATVRTVRAAYPSTPKHWWNTKTANRSSWNRPRGQNPMNKAACHPEKTVYCRGLCRRCYNNEPDIKAANKKWRQSAKRKAWAKKYDKTPVRARCFRRCRHAFDAVDEARFSALKYCDWCYQSLRGELPDIDHDRSCCRTARHCHKCTRGFVHHTCNIQAIAYAEWLEREFGVTSGQLEAYRLRFPRRLM